MMRDVRFTWNVGNRFSF